MKKFRQWYWFLSSMVKRYIWVIVISAGIGIVFTFNFETIIQILPKSKTIHIGRVGSYTLEQLPDDIQALVSDGLTEVNNEGIAQPDIAQTWNVDNDGTVYRFTINPETRWNDGSELTTADIDLNFQDVEVNKDGPYELSFQLTEPFAPFPVILNQPLFKRQQVRSFLVFRRTNILGTGEYIIDKIRLVNGVISEMRLSGGNDRRLYRFYSTEEEAITSFKQGKVDRLENISNPRDLSDWSNVVIEETIETDEYVAAFFNTTHPTFSSKAVRQALAYAIPKNADPGMRALGPVVPTSFAYNPQIKPYDFSPSQASELMEGEFDSNEPLPTIEITTTAAYEDLADIIVAAWNELGFNTKLKIVNFPDTNDFEVLLIGQRIPADPDQYNLWHSTQATNFTHYNSPRVDKLLEDGRKTLDEEERTLIYQDFQRFLLEDVPAVFLEHLVTYTVARR